MTFPQKINTNNQVQVILTAYGATIYNQWQITRGVRLKLVGPKKAGDKLKMGLWQAMQIFGSSIHMGMIEVPFLNNEIEFLPS